MLRRLNELHLVERLEDDRLDARVESFELRMSTPNRSWNLRRTGSLNPN